MLAQDRYLLGWFNFRRQPDSPMESVRLYSYESHSKLYDVMVVDGLKWYRTNNGPWSGTINHITRYHNDVERHFGI